MAEDTPEERIKALEDRVHKLELWEAEHDGRINSYWEMQFRFNKKVEDKFANHDIRFSAIEKRLMWISGVFATLGGVGGGFISRIFS